MSSYFLHQTVYFDGSFTVKYCFLSSCSRPNLNQISVHFATQDSTHQGFVKQNSKIKFEQKTCNGDIFPDSGGLSEVGQQSGRGLTEGGVGEREESDWLFLTVGDNEPMYISFIMTVVHGSITLKVSIEYYVCCISR